MIELLYQSNKCMVALWNEQNFNQTSSSWHTTEFCHCDFSICQLSYKNVELSWRFQFSALSKYLWKCSLYHSTEFELFYVGDGNRTFGNWFETNYFNSCASCIMYNSIRYKWITISKLQPRTNHQSLLLLLYHNLLIHKFVSRNRLEKDR